MGRSNARLDGIGEPFLAALSEVGIKNRELLLNRAKDRRGRRQLATETGISEALILHWVNTADLMRIRGVGHDYCELLRATGVDTVRDLRHRNASNLAAALQEVNARQRLVREAPGEKRVASWIAQAKLLPTVITH
ncbi:DUF4332 domain-containing protein [Rhodoligotrophos ferricapiens]|uniref:DUF4332 domain-containing protein n=1 Tax=Rhodoligotrophos ferricapiens TaxID=3069264 RepID=UPI00315D2497